MKTNRMILLLPTFLFLLSLACSFPSLTGSSEASLDTPTPTETRTQVPTGETPVPSRTPTGTPPQSDPDAQAPTGLPSATPTLPLPPTPTSTPTVTPTEPPPPPPPPAPVQNSDVDGQFPENFVWHIELNPDFFVRFYVHDDRVGTEDGDGIDLEEGIRFRVSGEDGDVLTHSEQTSGYCIFGGGEPDCNTWVLEDGVYKWERGGAPVEPGIYTLRIEATLLTPSLIPDGSETETVDGMWFFEFSIP
jgi:hypothetical protein